jgi:rare lipoprotein A
MRWYARPTFVVLVALVASGCASRSTPAPTTPAPTTPAPTTPAPTTPAPTEPAPTTPTPTAPTRKPSSAARALEAREGLASYYSDWFNGRTTASGTIFDNGDLVAAHPTYPFGSLVRVVNLRNKRSIDLRIVDRGPAPTIVARGVIIDVSRAAARQLGFITEGRTRVRVEVLDWGGGRAR